VKYWIMWRKYLNTGPRTGRSIYAHEIAEATSIVLAIKVEMRANIDVWLEPA